MIGVYLCGGIGNQMFIIARGESWRKQGYEVIYPNVDFSFEYLEKNFEWQRHAREYRTIFKNFDYDAFKKEVVLKKRKLIPMVINYPPTDGIEYNGYFQSEKNFFSREFIEWLFEPSDRVGDMLTKYDSLLSGNVCSIHVRRGDYLRSQTHHPVLLMDYYDKAISFLEPQNIDRFIVVSNDLPWCKDNFKGDEFVFMEDKDYVELFAMTRCRHHIISNSAFAWWGAWLNEKPDSIIIAPKVWFGSALPALHSENIVPERWIRL